MEISICFNDVKFLNKRRHYGIWIESCGKSSEGPNLLLIKQALAAVTQEISLVIVIFIG